MNPGSPAPQAQFKSLSLNWRENKEDFLEYLKSKGYNVRYVKCILSYLSRFVGIIREPQDIMKIFSPLTLGQQHNLNRALRVLFNFYEVKGVSKDYLNALRKAIPKDRTGVDLKIPSEQEILNSLRKLPYAPMKYQALYHLLLDSGLRLIEAARLINQGKVKDAVKVKDFYRCTLGYFRGSKLAYVAYFLSLIHI